MDAPSGAFRKPVPAAGKVPFAVAQGGLASIGDVSARFSATSPLTDAQSARWEDGEWAANEDEVAAEAAKTLYI